MFLVRKETLRIRKKHCSPWFTATLNNKRVSVMFATTKTRQGKQSYVVNIKLVDGA